MNLCQVSETGFILDEQSSSGLILIPVGFVTLILEWGVRGLLTEVMMTKQMIMMLVMDWKGRTKAMTTKMMILTII